MQFNTDKIESDKFCDFNQIYKDYVEDDCKNQKYMNNFTRKIDKFITNSKYVCQNCNIRFIDSNLSNPTDLCNQCIQKPRFTRELGYQFNEIPSIIKEATTLELSLLSLNIPTTRVFMALPNGTGAKRFK